MGSLICFFEKAESLLNPRSGVLISLRSNDYCSRSNFLRHSLSLVLSIIARRARNFRIPPLEHGTAVLFLQYAKGVVGSTVLDNQHLTITEYLAAGRNGVCCRVQSGWYFG